MLFQFLSAEYSSIVSDVNLPESIFSNDDNMTGIAFVPCFCVRYRPIQPVARNPAAVEHPPVGMRDEHQWAHFNALNLPIGIHAYRPFLGRFWFNEAKLELLPKDQSRSGDASCSASRRLRKM